MPGDFTLSLVVAVAENGVIGRAGKLPWRLGSDLKRFRKLTLGHPVVMGRATFESIGRPLDGRDNIIVTRTTLDAGGGTYRAASLEDALALARKFAKERGVNEIFIIGGAQLFAVALPLAGRIYLTRVHARPEGDTFWEPNLSMGWVERKSSARPVSPRDEYAVTDLVLERTRA
jgi:dihydrofolate reductase